MESVRQELERRAARLFAERGAGALRPADFAARIRPATVPAAAAAPPPSARPRSAETLDFSLMFFSAAAGEGARPGLYRLVHEAARFADARGFSAIWLPERHFHPFGGPYPDPASLAASLAPVTSRLRLRAGSVVLPLHHPVAVAERWSVVDNLSGGRVELAFGSGWNPNDFVLSPGTFADAKGVMRRRIEEVRTLWRGGSLSLPNGRGETVPTRIFPAPLQPELPVWVSATGNPETFAWAGGAGFGILTMLLGGEIDDIAPKIAAYRAGRAAAGLDPDAGRVGLMLHSFVHPDGDLARAAIRAPFLDYVRSSVDVQRHGTEAGRALSAAQREQIVAYAFERYTRSAALFGTPAECRPMLERVAAAGVDEVACLVDFGVDEDLVIGALEHLDAMRPRRPEPPPASAPYPVRGAAAEVDEPVAIIGMSGRFPGSPDLAAFWDNLCAGRSLIGPPPPGRGSLPGGYLDDVEGFDAALFGIAPAEAAAMDPHQRIFLEQVRAALEDAGLRPSALRGSDTGVFAAIYSHSHEAALRRQGGALDGLAVAGAVLSMVPNRASFLFDWTGPSEAVNTACSSGLVAVHRAAAALRAGECRMAVAGGVSLLLAPEETDALAELGILSPTGTCRAFDRGADGQVRGEGAGVVLLKRLADAERDGDFIHAVIRGSAVNHGGARAASLTLPNPRLQAACIGAAIRRAGVDPARIGYVEAHGAGTAIGDLTELSALEQALGAAGSGVCLVGSVKPNIGSLDAAGGIAGLIKAVLALRHGRVPPSINRTADPDGFAPGRLRVADAATGWAGADRFAGVHAYGLGGTNAHVVLAAHPDRRPEAAPGSRIVSLAARDEALLRGALASLLAALDAAPETPLADIAHTLEAGREGGSVGWRAEVADTAALRLALRARLADPAPFGPAQAAPAQPGRRIPLPATPFARLPATPFARPAAAGSSSPDEGVVGAFYDFVTRAEGRAGEEIFLTLAPLPEIVPGFSWTRTFQNPEAHAAHWRMMQAAQREMRAVLFDGVDFAAVRHMIDFGCGVGTDLIALARRHPHLTGTGYTISPRQAAIASERIAAAGLADRLAVRCADSAHTPFPQPAELIFGFEVAHHIADKEALFANLAAHLSPGGWLVLADCAANTLAPIDRPDVGSFTSPKPDYAALLARHGFAVEECVDVSTEIANFLHDPDLEMMISDERSAAPGQTDAVALMAAVQRSWDGFGQALRAGVISYLLLSARKRAGEGLAALNRQQMGLA
jgi:natural product biosynthesis luciferase-like monooxygenase protein